MKLLLATRNLGKFLQIKAQLQDLPLDLISLNDVTVDDSKLTEDGSTLAENALKKARFYAQSTKLTTLADDSGIIVEALNNELGVKTHRWGLGEKVSDQEWVEYFLKRLAADTNRKAYFVCHACLMEGNGDILVKTEGITPGIEKC